MSAFGQLQTFYFYSFAFCLVHQLANRFLIDLHLQLRLFPFLLRTHNHSSRPSEAA
jgi:hypothetical protein